MKIRTFYLYPTHRQYNLNRNVMDLYLIITNSDDLFMVTSSNSHHTRGIKQQRYCYDIVM